MKCSLLARRVEERRCREDSGSRLFAIFRMLWRVLGLFLYSVVSSPVSAYFVVMSSSCVTLFGFSRYCWGLMECHVLRNCSNGLCGFSVISSTMLMISVGVWALVFCMVLDISSQVWGKM